MRTPNPLLTPALALEVIRNAVDALEHADDFAREDEGHYGLSRTKVSSALNDMRVLIDCLVPLPSADGSSPAPTLKIEVVS